MAFLSTGTRAPDDPTHATVNGVRWPIVGRRRTDKGHFFEVAPVDNPTALQLIPAPSPGQQWKAHCTATLVVHYEYPASEPGEEK